MSSRSSSRAAAAHQFPAMARLRAAVAAPRSNAGAGGGALVPPGVVELGDRVAEPGADGAGVAADDLPDGHLADAEGAGDAGRAVAHHVQGPQPQPGAAGVHAAARDGLAGHGEHRGGGAAVRAGGGRGPGPRRWPGPGPRRRRCRGRCRRPGAAGGRERGPGPGRWPGTAGQAWPGTGPAGGLMLTVSHRLGLVAGGSGGLAGAAGGVQGAGDLGVGQAGLAGGVGQRAQVGGGVGLQGAVGGPEQAGVAVAFGLGGDPAGQVAQITVRGRAGWRAAGAAAGVAGAG